MTCLCHKNGSAASKTAQARISHDRVSDSTRRDVITSLNLRRPFPFASSDVRRWGGAVVSSLRHTEAL